MNRTTLFTGSILIAVCFAAIAWSAGDKDAEALKQAERDWSAATVKHDPSVVQRLIAEDYVGTDGRVFSTKADEIEEAKEHAPEGPLAARVIAEEIADLKVRFYDDIGIVNGRTIQQVERAGVKSEVQFRRTTVWVMRQGVWQCVSFHGSRLLNPPAK
ncbi:MAG TPA: nuclear transport factor 2 family protein [Steroidobacteraceae bacterium]|nr:nuclear transport factor 2 family protein [Steroidobacteraceae bacterium]